MSASTPSPSSTEPSGLFDRAFLSLFLVSFLSGFINAPFMALLPVYVEADLGRSALFTADLRALMLVLGGVFAVIGGRLCDTLGLKTTLLIGLTGSALSGLVFRTGDPLFLVGLILFIGASHGPISTAGQSYLISAVSTQRMGIGGGLYFLSHTLGNALGNLTTGGLLDRWTLGQLGGIMPLATLAVVALAMILLPARSTAAKAAANTKTKEERRLNLWHSYGPLLRLTDVRLLIGMRYCITTFWGMASLILPLLIYRASGTKASAAFYAALSLAVAAAGQLLTGYLRDRYGRFWPVIISASGVALCALCLALWSNSLTALFVFGTALTTTAWALSTVVPALINDVATAQAKNRLVGLAHFVWSGAMVSGSLIGGYLVDVNPALPFYLGAVLGLTGTYCGWRLCLRLDRSLP
jgi:MFS family permease